MTAKGRLSHSTSRNTRNSVGSIVGWKISEKLSPDSSDRWVDSSYRPLGCEDRGKLQTQILCDADDNPRRRMNTECQEKRDPYLTQILDPVCDRMKIRVSTPPVTNVNRRSSRKGTSTPHQDTDPEVDRHNPRGFDRFEKWSAARVLSQSCLWNTV